MLVLASTLHSIQATAETETFEFPNIILILIDDQGWTDLSTPMDERTADSSSDFYETPNIDLLAQQSLRFSSGYAPSPICTPSRASILTGKSPQQLGFTDIPESRPGSRRFSDLYTGKKLIAPQPLTGLPEDEVTIAEIIRTQVDEDYATAHFGKWHLGGGGPARHGFEAHDGSTGNHNLSAHSPDPNPKDVFGVTGRAITFMKSQVYSKRPFFMQLSHYANHVPLSAMNDTIAKYQAKKKGNRHNNAVYAALNENLDTSIGRLMGALTELEIEDNTYVFYTSDNGGSKNTKNPSTNNAPLREGKTWVYEGGIRVPFMVRGPGIESGESAIPVIGWDLFPTFCAILECDGSLPDGVEGGNLLPLLSGQTDGIDRPRGESLYWHFPHYLSAKGTTPHSAIRLGDYKLIRFYHFEESKLFDLGSDIGEATDLSQQYPKIKKDLEERLVAYLSDIKAGMPEKNQFQRMGKKAPRAVDLSVQKFKAVELQARHTSVFSKIRYSIPRGWVVVDGESDWLAPSTDKQFWKPDFDASSDAYFVVSAIPPYLTLADRQKKHVSSLEQLAEHTIHSLKVTDDATLDGDLQYISLNNKNAVSFTVALGETHALTQSLVQITADKVATVAGSGPRDQMDSIRDLVLSIAATIEWEDG